ncbi:MAG: 6-pyruvoyl-tetrahydropterin synthase-related protein [Candidatus Acidiferrales bacterium]
MTAPAATPPAAATASSANFSWVATLLLVSLASTAVVTPLLLLSNASGHDIQFHLSSWMDVAGQWREGIVFPRWAEWANWGFGEPRFVFYPPASWLIGAALGSVLPWPAVPGAYIWLALIVAGMSMWKLAREWLPGRQAAAAAVLFAVNPYNLAIVYYRSDFAELLAAAFLPLLLSAALGMIRHMPRRFPFLAMALAAIWLCNAPEGVIATYSLALVLVVASIRRCSLRPLLSGGAAMLAGFGLAAFYILPAAWEQRWVEISQALAANLRPERNFIFTSSNDPEFLIFNWKISAVALAMMLLAGESAVFVARRRRELAEVWWALLWLATAASFLMFRPSTPLWRYLPKLAFVQFPWRWLEPLAVAFAFFLAAAIGLIRQRRASALALVAVLALIGITGRLIAKDTWWDDGDVPFLAGEIADGHGYEGTDEYAPVGSDRYQLPGATPDAEDIPDVAPTPPVAAIDPGTGKIIEAPGTQVKIIRWQSERKAFVESSAKPVTLALRLVNYPAWEVRVDGNDVQAASADMTAEMLLPLPPGSHQVEARLRRTWDCTAGETISLLSVFGLMGYTWRLRGRASASAVASALPDARVT